MSDPFTPGLLSRLPEAPRKVALMRASRIGDFICATPAFRALRAALPQAEMTLIALPFVRKLVERSPHLDRFTAFPGFPGIAEQFFDARRAIAFFQQMQAEQFDLAVQMHGSGIYANPFTLMLGARVTVGFVRPGDAARRLDAALPMPQEGHEVQRVLALTTFLGAPAQGTATEFPLWPEDHTTAEALLAGVAPPLIGLHPAARDAPKRWAPEQFAAVGAELLRRHGGTVIVIGGPEERSLAETVARAVAGAAPAGRRSLNLSGQTSLSVLGGVIARLAVLVTNDSGPAHIAYALGTPAVTIFSATDPATWGPPTGGPHRVLQSCASCQPHGEPLLPMGQVTTPQVIAAADELMRL
jgi:ADP-heptose:LPS heptosyltransferase